MQKSTRALNAVSCALAVVGAQDVRSHILFQESDILATSSNTNNVSESSTKSAPSPTSEDDDDESDPDPEPRQKSNYRKSKIPLTQEPYSLPSEGLVRLKEVLIVIPVGKSTWWKGVANGRFPQPTRELGKRITAWRVEDIRAIIKDPSLNFTV